MCFHGTTENHFHSRPYLVLYISLQDQKTGHNVQVVDVDYERNNPLIAVLGMFPHEEIG